MLSSLSNETLPFTRSRYGMFIWNHTFCLTLLYMTRYISKLMPKQSKKKKTLTTPEKTLKTRKCQKKWGTRWRWCAADSWRPWPQPRLGRPLLHTTPPASLAPESGKLDFSHCANCISLSQSNVFLSLHQLHLYQCQPRLRTEECLSMCGCWWRRCEGGKWWQRGCLRRSVMMSLMKMTT